MWILTNGFNIGVTKQISDAIKNHMEESFFKNSRDSNKNHNNDSNIRITVIGIVREEYIKHDQLKAVGSSVSYSFFRILELILFN